MDSYGAGDARCLQFQQGLGYPYSGYSSSDRYSGGGPGPYPGQLPGWGYISLYLVILILGIVGNFLFCLIVKKVRTLHRSHHFFYLAISVMDILVCILVIPFALDAQAKVGRWRLPEFLCKFYLFMDWALRGVHAFLLVLGSLFLYFWYRKNESYLAESGEVTTRRTRMHKWAVPLAWVLGLGLAIPAGAVASMSCGQCGVFHAQQNAGRQGTEYWVNLAYLLAAFLLPWLVLMFPLMALLMQLCGARQPRLDPPHSRTAAIMVTLILLFIASRAPHDIWELKNMLSSQYGTRGNPYNAGYTSLETQMTLDCFVYVPMLLHPILFLLLQPEYRAGFREMWRTLYCNKDAAAREAAKQARYKNHGQPQQPILKQQPGGRGRGYRKSKEGGLVQEQQPMIIPAQQQQQQYQQRVGAPYLPSAGQTVNTAQHGQPYIPLQQLSPQQEPLLDHSTSFEMESPAGAADPVHKFPAQFEYGNFKYIDSARVEPKIAYTPTNTPPKTPQIPHFDFKPFKQPNYVDGTWNFPVDQEAYTGSVPAHQIPIGGFARLPSDPAQPSSAAPVMVDDEEEEPVMEIESLESSPGNTLRRGREPADILAAAARNAGKVENRPDSVPKSITEMNTLANQLSRPTTPSNTVEITLQGRTRSRQDLCPDRPRSRFEHAV